MSAAPREHTPKEVEEALHGKQLFRGVSGQHILETARALEIRDFRVAAVVAVAITRMQANLKMHRERKHYGEMLFDKYLHEEEAQRDEERRKIEEGMKLLERRQTERDLLDERLLRGVRSKESGLKQAPPDEIGRAHV